MNDCCRDTLAPVLALCDEVEHMGWGSASDYDKGGQRCAERIRAAVETPDQPEGQRCGCGPVPLGSVVGPMCPECRERSTP